MAGKSGRVRPEKNFAHHRADADRADLVAILAEALERAQPGALHLGVTLTDIDNRADGVAIATASGET
ncbi:hypothetical protein, partial [Blastomonas sp. UPD001]|uniref:hypothetical protein n=1 Tax=Blastomonas sp. UPD001 TaxID=2217673 RepID=UPI001E5175C1